MQPSPPSPFQPRLALVASAVAIFTVTFLIALKFWVFLGNGSTSILASLIDSAMDASVSCMTFLALHFSLKPADSEHRHGHGKIEGLAALFQSLFIAGAGLFLLAESISRFHQPLSNDHQGVAVIIMATAAFLSSVLISVQTYTLSRAPSLAIEADRAHYSMDVLINLGAMGILLALQKGFPAWIDPAFAILVSVYFLWTAKNIMSKALDMLLDRELSSVTRQKIKDVVLTNPQIMGMHDLRTSQSGMRMFMSFDIELDPQLILRDAHEIVREAELALFAEFPSAEIMIHVDPFGDIEDTRHLVPGIHDKKY